MILLEDVMIAARTCYGEARGEGYVGMKAVAHVLLNRWKFKSGDADHSLAAAALRWLQFSAWDEKDVNREALEFANFDKLEFRQAVRGVLEAIDEPDFTFGSRHYHTKDTSPKWASGHVPAVVIGSHAFYNDID